MELGDSTIDIDHGAALPAGTRLGNFEVRSVIGAGGFGVVYRALDHALEREVAIKEYMPATLATRSATAHVSVRSRSDQEVFHLGLASFVKEAKMLASFDHPALIKVLHFWEENATAYMAMPLLRGRTLKALRQESQQAPSQRMLVEFLEPLFGALEYLHKQDVFHRDISPDNIHVAPDGRPILLDFGAARRVIAGKSQALTTILKPAYSPLEQYGDTQRQGAWTDLYALGATVHFVITGAPPIASTERMIDDRLPLLAEMPLPGYSVRFLQVIDWMLALRPAARPQSVAQVLAAFAGRAEVPAAARAVVDEEVTRIRPPAVHRPGLQDLTGERERRPPTARSRVHLAVAGGALLSLGPVTYWLWRQPSKSPEPGPAVFGGPTKPTDPPAPIVGTAPAPIVTAVPLPMPSTSPAPIAEAGVTTPPPGILRQGLPPSTMVPSPAQSIAESTRSAEATPPAMRATVPPTVRSRPPLSARTSSMPPPPAGPSVQAQVPAETATPSPTAAPAPQPIPALTATPTSPPTMAPAQAPASTPAPARAPRVNILPAG